jgi:hypothetical protein
MEELQGRVVAAVRRLQAGIRWKPGKALQHLAKHVELGHLPVETTLADYEVIIIMKGEASNHPRQVGCLCQAIR